MTQTQQPNEIPRAYEPGAVEGRIYDFWTEGGYFTPEIDRSKKPFTLIMPPPNVTGELHMGHALTIALEDLMVRWHRMQADALPSGNGPRGNRDSGGCREAFGVRRHNSP